MSIDIITIILLAIAVWKGYTRGLVVALFSFAAIIIGIAAALKLSVAVAQWLQSNTNISGWWLPFISFILVMIAVAIIIRWAAKLIEAGLKFVLLGWINKLGGIALYIMLEMAVYSVVLFYAAQMNILSPQTIDSSQTYAVIEPWAPKIISTVAYIIPFFQNMFEDLERFFSSIANKI